MRELQKDERRSDVISENFGVEDRWWWEYGIHDLGRAKTGRELK